MSCVNHVTVNETALLLQGVWTCMLCFNHVTVIAMLYSNECGTCMSCVTHVTVNETI